METRNISYKELHDKGFYHEWMKDTDETIVNKIDKIIGSWPVSENANYLKFYHGDKDKGRVMCFFSDGHNEPYWTVVMSKERYFELKKVVQIKVKEIELN